MQATTQAVSEKAVLAIIGITEADLVRRKELVGLGPEDQKRIATVRDLIARHVDELTEIFFRHLSALPEAKVLLGYRELTDQARTLKRAHLLEMASGNYDAAYAEQRIKLGLLYGRVGLETKVIIGAFEQVMLRAGELIMREVKDPLDAFQRFSALQKVALLDIGLHSDMVIYERERTIGRQSEAIRELSTPVLQVRDRLLLLPLIGVIDTHRAQMVTEGLLHAIRETRARMVVIDVTGVATVDSKVANHLLQTVTAARLMGARTIISGVTAEVAQSMVALGVELSPFTTVGDLQTGIEYAERALGYRINKEVADVGTHSQAR